MRAWRWLLVLVSALTLAVSAPAQEGKGWLQVDILREGVPASLTRVQISTGNIEKVQCALYRVTPEQFLQYVAHPRFTEGYVFSHVTARSRRALREPEGAPAQRWESRLNLRERIGNVSYYSRTIFLPKVGSGVYYLRVSAGRVWQGQFVLVSRVGCIAKHAAEGALLYVYDYESGQPAEGARLTLLDRKRRPHYEVRTAAEGTAQLSAQQVRGSTALYLRHGENVLFYSLYDDPALRSSRWKLYLYTDRPIYRPGQQVHYKVVLRQVAGQEYRNAPAQEVNLRLEDPRGRTLFRTRMRTGDLGSCADTYRLNAEATIGEYTLIAEREGEEAYALFEVAAYRKPDFEVRVTPEQPLYVGAGKGVFLVQARYFFDAPVAEGKVRYTVQARPHFLWRSAPSDEDEPAPLYPNLFPSDTYRADRVVAEGEVTTDAQGRARIEFDLQPRA